MRLGDASRGGDSHLWSEVLEYFARQSEDCTEQVQSSLQPHVQLPMQPVLPPPSILAPATPRQTSLQPHLFLPPANPPAIPPATVHATLPASTGLRFLMRASQPASRFFFGSTYPVSLSSSSA